MKNAKFVFQICAADEFRENFSLTNIKSAGINSLEITLPGVHSDIGGGYVDEQEEKVLIYKDSSISNCEVYKNILVEEGWYQPEQLSIETIAYRSRDEVSYKYKLWGTRKLSNHYDKIPLSYMFHYSKYFAVVYDNLLLQDHEIRDDYINSIYGKLTEYVSACNSLRNNSISNNISDSDYLKSTSRLNYLNFNIEEKDLKKLRNKYLHWSAYLDGIGAMKPRVSGVKKEEERKRTILDG